MVVGNMVDIPTLKSGTCRIGVYAVETADDQTVLRYSPSPATVFVSSGTYNENLHIDPPTQSEADRIYSLINKAIEGRTWRTRRARNPRSSRYPRRKRTTRRNWSCWRKW